MSGPGRIPLSRLDGQGATPGQTMVFDGLVWKPGAAAGGGAAAPARRTVTLLVAASNSPDIYKTGADVVCTGTNDNQAIQTALNAAESGGAPALVLFAPGSYVWATLASGENGLVLNSQGTRLEGMVRNRAVIFVGAGSAAGTSQILGNAGAHAVRGLWMQNTGTTATPDATYTGISLPAGPSIVEDCVLALQGYARHGVLISGRVSRCTISGVRIGIFCNSASTSVPGVLIEGNSVTACQTGISSSAGPLNTVRENTLVGSNFAAATSPGYGVGIELGAVSGIGSHARGNHIDQFDRGIVMSSNESVIDANFISFCRREGIVVEGSRNRIVANLVRSCGQDAATNIYDGIVITTAGSPATRGIQNMVANNRSSGTRHRYNLAILTGCSRTIVAANDLFVAGATGAYLDQGTSTLLAAANLTA